MVTDRRYIGELDPRERERESFMVVPVLQCCRTASLTFLHTKRIIGLGNRASLSTASAWLLGRKQRIAPPPLLALVRGHPGRPPPDKRMHCQNVHVPSKKNTLIFFDALQLSLLSPSLAEVHATLLSSVSSSLWLTETNLQCLLSHMLWFLIHLQHILDSQADMLLATPKPVEATNAQQDWHLQRALQKARSCGLIAARENMNPEPR